MNVYSVSHLLSVFWIPLTIIALSYGLLVLQLRNGAKKVEKTIVEGKTVSCPRSLGYFGLVDFVKNQKEKKTIGHIQTTELKAQIRLSRKKCQQHAQRMSVPVSTRIRLLDFNVH